MSYKANSNIIKVSTAGVVGANGLIVGNPDTTAKDASAALEIESTTGGLLLPRVTTVQRNAIASPTQGLLVENTTTDRAEVKAFSGWQRVMTEETAAITESQIVNSAVTTNKINDSAVTRTKLASVGQQISASSGAFSTTSFTFVDVTNLNATITTTGRPVVISIISDGSGNYSYLGTFFNAGATAYGLNINILRSGTEVARHKVEHGLSSTSFETSFYIPSSFIYHVDVLPAGTYTYKIQMHSLFGAPVYLNYSKLCVYEL